LPQAKSKYWFLGFYFSFGLSAVVFIFQSVLTRLKKAELNKFQLELILLRVLVFVFLALDDEHGFALIFFVVFDRAEASTSATP
jgi:hypothetical protein